MLPLWTEYLNPDRGRGVKTARRINGEPVGSSAFKFPEDPAVKDSPIRLDVERQDKLRIRYVENRFIPIEHDPVCPFDVTGKPRGPALGVDVVNRGVGHPPTLGKVDAAIGRAP